MSLPAFHNQVIDISHWRHDDRYDGVYSEGAREKDVYFSTDEPLLDCIKPDWRYMFKLPRSEEWCPWQFWMEIIAYRLGCLIGVPVPPAHVGYNDSYDNGGSPARPAYGALIEWFYDEREQGYADGGQLMMQVVKDYDRDRGEKHNFEAISQVFKAVPNFAEHWAGVFTLDSLIANIDRHQDNWGLIIHKHKPAITFSPAFDNGTAMEYGEQEENFHKYLDPNKLKSHLTNPKRAKHHMKWSLKSDKPLNFYGFMAKFVIEFPASKSIIEKHLSFTRQEAEDILCPLCEVVSDEKYRLTWKRLDFVLGLIFERKKLLENAINEL